MVGLRDRVAFEGQAAMELEYALEGTLEETAYPLPTRDGDPAIGDWEPLVRALLADLARGEPPAHVSARFHNALVDFGAACARLADCRQVVLSGGCFQNAVLTDRLCRRLGVEGFDVYTHRDLPPNDGGIAAGQVLVARAQWKERHDVPRRTG
jgi:hydrogenase maturation protein HypF